VLTARSVDFGVAFVVGEEVSRLPEAASWRAHAQAIGLAEHLAEARGPRAVSGLLARLYAHLALDHVRRCETEPAQGAVLRALQLGPKDPVSRIRVLHARGVLASALGDAERARHFLGQAADLAHPDRPLRTLELLMLGLFVGAWDARTIEARVVEALELGAKLRADDSDIVRAHALLLTARLLVSALTERCFGRPAPAFVRTITDELDAASDLFATLGPGVRAARDLNLGTLLMSEDCGRAVTLLQNAAENYIAAGEQDAARQILETIAGLVAREKVALS